MGCDLVVFFKINHFVWRGIVVNKGFWKEIGCGMTVGLLAIFVSCDWDHDGWRWYVSLEVTWSSLLRVSAWFYMCRRGLWWVRMYGRRWGYLGLFLSRCRVRRSVGSGFLIRGMCMRILARWRIWIWRWVSGIRFFLLRCSMRIFNSGVIVWACRCARGLMIGPRGKVPITRISRNWIISW